MHTFLQVLAGLLQTVYLGGGLARLQSVHEVLLLQVEVDRLLGLHCLPLLEGSLELHQRTLVQGVQQFGRVRGLVPLAVVLHPVEAQLFGEDRPEGALEDLRRGGVPVAVYLVAA